MQCAMKKLFVIIGFTILASACSNPFSSQKPVALKENPSPKNTNCTNVRFDESQVTIKQLRGMIHCLNQSSELKEIEDWSLTVSDDEFSPLIRFFNETLTQDPELIYALKETYLEYSKNGELNKIIDQLLKNLQTSEKRTTFISLIQNHSKWLNQFFSDQKHKINLEKLSLLTEVKSFRRILDEQYLSKNHRNILTAVAQYHSQKDAISFQEMFRFFSKTNLSEKKESAEKLAGFLNWLIEDNKITILSKAAESLIRHPINCFNEEVKINDSIDVLLTRLSSIKPEEVNSFIQKKITSYILLGNGYCKIPAEVTKAAKIILEATNQDTLPEFFSFIQPVLKDKVFIELLASSPFRELTEKINQSNNKHLFQDLISITNWLKNNPIIENNSAELLDSLLNEFNDTEISDAISLIPDEASFYRSLQKAYLSLPEPKHVSKKTTTQNWLAPFTKDSFKDVIEFISRMNSDKKIIPILDRVIEIFKTLIESGKNGFKKIIHINPKHSKSTNSQLWELPYWKPSNTYIQSKCHEIELDYPFFAPSPSSLSSDYLNKIENLGTCFNTNQSFVELKDLVKYLANKENKFNEFNRFQAEALGFSFSLNKTQALNSIENVLQLKPNDLKKLKLATNSTSNLLLKSKKHLKSSTEIRKLISSHLSKQETYKALLTQMERDVFLTSDKSKNLKIKLYQLTIENLPSLFKEFCESIDTRSSECDIESDQVTLYKSSPEKLAIKIVEEYMYSSTSWLHPNEFSNWKFQKNADNDVSNFNFHLNPLLEQFNSNKKSFDSIFGFIKRNNNSKNPLLSFLSEKSSQYQVIPYIFKKANYPKSNQEYHQRIRLRIVSDLDRLELLAINSDFQAFGMVQNFGMSFITEIARSWGDESISDRPSLGTSETISEARFSILQQFSRFNSSILQRVGSCDPRGRGRLGNAINEFLCRGEVGDIRARMFNLKYMLSILDDENELKLLRDLFYSIYENNNQNQFGVYSNGVKNQNHSNVDLLEMIPKIAHLGLLHQASLSLSKDQSKTASSLIEILKSVMIQNKEKDISTFISSEEGKNFIKKTLLLGLELNPTESGNLSSIINNVEKVENMEWLMFIINVTKKYPDLILDYSPTLHFLLNGSQMNDLSPEMIKLVSDISKDLNHQKLIDETSILLLDLSKSQNELISVLDFDFSNLVSKDWLKDLSAPQHQKFRTQISNFIQGERFDLFCDVFSDATLMNKTYNFLESSHQNSDVLELLQDCRRFLH